MRLVISALLSCAFECLILRKSSKVMHMAERQSAQLVIRVQPALRKELESVAAAERRPLGNLVRALVGICRMAPPGLERTTLSMSKQSGSARFERANPTLRRLRTSLNP
jgi:hypothetical protein